MLQVLAQKYKHMYERWKGNLLLRTVERSMRLAQRPLGSVPLATSTFDDRNRIT